MNEVATIGNKILVDRARSGDSEAFSRLVREHHAQVWRFLMKWVRNRDDAEELAQETFLAAWRGLANFRGAAQFSTWLLGIALNLARNHHNRSAARNREAELPDEEHLADLLAPAPGPHELLVQKSTLAALDRAIARLPRDMREVIVMVTLEGLALGETAAMLGIPVGTVKSRLSRAKERLLQDMEGYLP